MKKFSVLIIGAGNIAQGFDEPDSPGSIRTHVKGYMFYSDVFDVKAFCDPNLEILYKATEKWGLKNAYTSIDAIDDFSFDVVSICTPDHTHSEILRQIIDKGPRVIFLEKPMGMKYEEAKQIFQVCLEKGILLLINYSRLFIPSFVDIKKWVNKKNNKLLSVDIRYHKGLNHNCSHFINLIVYLFQAELKRVILIDSITDYSEDDPTVSAVLFMNTKEGNSFKMNIQGVDHHTLNLTEIDIISSFRRVIYRESKGSHIHYYNTVEYFDGMILKEFIEDDNVKVDYNKAFINAIGFICNYLNNVDIKSEVIRLQESVLSTIKVTDQIQKNLKDFNI
jgi:predicted dehydrogenase